MQIGSRRRDHCSARTSRSADGDGRHNRGLIALFVVIICSRSAVRGGGACARTGSVAECGRAPITDRAQGMEVLRRPAEGGPRPRRRLVGGPPAERDPAGGVRDRDGCARRRRATR